ncbi:YHYH protein [Kiloniella laminariae]|uniref:YHYH protein n=1 Tax=Kiloniella laminariae TaxID=454162 RepID=UPI000A06CB6A
MTGLLFRIIIICPRQVILMSAMAGLCITPDYPQGTYAYFLTADYPFIPRLLRGTPDPSFHKRHGSSPQGKPPPPDTRPPKKKNRP